MSSSNESPSLNSNDSSLSGNSYLGKKLGVGFIITIMVSGCSGHYATASVAPLMQFIGDTWPDYAHLAFQAQSLPSLLMVPPVIFIGAIARVISKKHILMFGTLLFFLGGFLPIIFNSFYPFLIGRCFVGLGTGFMVAIPTTTVGVLFSGKKQNAMMGWLNGVGALFGMGLSASVGYVALYGGFIATYWIYVPMLIFFFLQWIFFPKFPPEKKDETIAKVDEQGNKIKIPRKTIIGIAGFLFWKVFVIVFVYIMAGIVETQAGGTVADSGLVMTVFTATAFIASLIFIPLFNKINNWVLPIGLICGIISFALMTTAHTMAQCYLIAVVHNVCMTMMYPWMWKTMASMTTKVWVTTGISFISFGSYFGQFAAPYMLQFINSIFGAGAPSYTFYSVMFAIFTVVGIVLVLKDKKANNSILCNIAK